MLRVVGEQISLSGFSRFMNKWLWSLSAVAARWQERFVQRLGALENMSFGEVPAIEYQDVKTRIAVDVENLKRFERMIQLIFILSDREVIEVQKVTVNDQIERHLIIAEKVPPELRPRLDELRRLIGLSNRNWFWITQRVTDIKEDEISIQTRSVMAMMGFMSKGIEVPPEHLAEGRVIDFRIPKSEKNPIPFTMRWSKEQPKNPFAAIRYQEYWYYIDNADIQSKRALNLILLLFRLQAPTPAGAAPVLTLPTG